MLENTHTISTGLWLYHLQLFADTQWFQHHSCLQIRILAMPGTNLTPTIVGCAGNAEGCSEHVGTGDQYRDSA